MHIPQVTRPLEWQTIWKNPIKLLALVGVVVTWPISAPIYGLVQLLAVMTQLSVIIGFANGYWAAISLAFLRKAIVPSPGATPPPPEVTPALPVEKPRLSIEKLPISTESPPLEHSRTSPSEKVDFQGLSSPSVWDDPITDEFVARQIEIARSCGDDLNLEAFLRPIFQRNCGLEFFHRCELADPFLSARVSGYISGRQNLRWMRRGMQILSTRSPNALMMCIPKFAECTNLAKQCETFRYILRHYPKRVSEISSAFGQYVESSKMWISLEDFRCCIDAEKCKECFSSGSNPARQLLGHLPRSAVANGWKATGIPLNTFISEQPPDYDTVLHILQGLPVNEAARELQKLSPSNAEQLIRDSCGLCPKRTARILLQIDPSLTETILRDSNFSLAQLFEMASEMKKQDHTKWAEFFPQEPSKIHKMYANPLTRTFSYVCMLTMAEDERLAFFEQDPHRIADLLEPVADSGSPELARIFWLIFKSGIIIKHSLPLRRVSFWHRLKQMTAKLAESRSFFAFVVKCGNASDADLAQFFNRFESEVFDGSQLLNQLPPERVKNIERLMAAGRPNAP